MGEWSYRVERVEGDSVVRNEKFLTDLGDDGWELVAVAAYTGTHYLYLKRPANRLTQREKT